MIDVTRESYRTDLERVGDLATNLARYGRARDDAVPLEVDVERVARDVAVDRSTLFDCYRTARELGRVADLAVTIADDRVTVEDGSREALATAADDARRLVETATTAVVEDASVERAQSILADGADPTPHANDGRDHLASAIEDTAASGRRIALIALAGALRRATDA